MAEVSGSYLIARTLKEEGVEALFFLMGGPNYEIVNYSEDFGIRTIDFRHEQAAAMAAHAYARVTGKPGVTTPAAGPARRGGPVTGGSGSLIMPIARTCGSSAISSGK